MAEDDDSKTEQPTSRKLDRAREEGNIAQSQEVKTAAMLVAGLAMVAIIAPPMMKKLSLLLATFLSQSYEIRIGVGPDLNRLLVDILEQVALLLAVPLAMFLVVAIVVGVAQAGWMVTFEKIMPDLSRINPLTGFGRMFSVQSLVELLKNVVKLIIVGAIAYSVVAPHLRDLESLPALDLMQILVYLHQLLLHMIIAIVVVVCGIAAADWFYQKFAFNQKMRMTKQEVKDEQKQVEGDPMIKARLRSLRMQRARQRMMAAVPKADVVVTNPTHYACALKYDMETMAAPVLVAKGQDLLALRIRQIAQENEVPIVENPPLARALHATVEIDSEIPPEHYKAVAEVISYVFKLKGKVKH